MLEYRQKAWSKRYPEKWKSLYYKSDTKGHLDFNKYSYKDGNKIYTGPNKAVQELFDKEYQQMLLWKKLNDRT